MLKFIATLLFAQVLIAAPVEGIADQWETAQTHRENIPAPEHTPESEKNFKLAASRIMAHGSGEMAFVGAVITANDAMQKIHHDCVTCGSDIYGG